MRIALGQINTTVGDLRGNADRMIAVAREAVGRGAEVVVFPELSITGYPPRDFVEKDSFLERSDEELDRFAAETAELDATLICGYVPSFRERGFPSTYVKARNVFVPP